MKKVILALATIFALTACGPATSSSDSTSNQESEPTTTETSTSEGTVEVEKHLSSIYGENAVYGELVAINNQAYPNIKGYHVVNDKSGKLLGHVFILEGTNTFGPIKMSIGINADETIGRVFLIENGQSNGKDEVVQKEYVDKFNKGEISFDDVACGATVGATLINEMGKQAQNFVKAEINKQITDFAPYCKEIFGSEKVEYIRRNNVLDSTNATLKEFWTVRDSETNKTLGRVYHAELNRNHLMVGINKGGEWGEEDPKKPQTFKKAFLVTATEDADVNNFIADLNDGKASLDADSKDSELVAGIKTMVNQSLAHAAKNKITNPYDATKLLAGTFGNEVSYCEQTIVDDPANPNILEYWNVKDANRNYIGRAYHLEAPGEHGALHVVVGVKPNNVAGGEFFKVSTEARTPDPTSNAGLQAYINGLNDGSIKIENEADAHCGATGTASGIRALGLIAVKHYGKNIIADIYLKETFGDKVSYIEKTVLENEHVREYWNVMGSDNQYIGRVYHCSFDGQHATLHTLVGTNVKGEFMNMYLVNRAPGEYGDKLQQYVNDLNNGDILLTDDIHNGATASSSAVRDIAKEALEHFKASPVLPTLKTLEPIQVLFDNTVTFDSRRKVSEKGFENVVEYWTVKDEAGNPIAGAYHCAFVGKHAIMEITVSLYPTVVNHKTSVKLGKINLMVKAPNKYGEILQQYVDDLNSGKVDINDDVHTGATASCNAVKTMVLQAIDHLSINQLDKGMSMDKALANTFGETAVYGEPVAVNTIAQDNLIEYWNVKDAENNFLGRVYHGAFPGTHGVLHALIAINNDGTLKTIYWANAPVGVPGIPPHVAHYGELALAWITKINNGEIKLTDDVHSGASATTGGIISLAFQALDHFALTK